MQATSIDDLFEIEDAVEGACKKLLNSAGIDNVYVQRDDENVATPRVNVQLKLGAATGQKLPDNYGALWVAAWNASLGFQVVTKRSKEATQRHYAIRAALRRIMLQCDSRGNPVAFGEDVLPYHCVLKILDSQTVPIIQGEDDLDESELHYSITVQIRNNSFPA